jgi:hypothetical protein
MENPARRRTWNRGSGARLSGCWRNGVKDKVKTFLLYLMNAIQAAKLYRDEHPKYREFVASLYEKTLRSWRRRRS